ncbi:MAG: glycosyltransferase, partial [Tenuifilum sp.]|uniref:glycosyltransferase n=1 Tax=Tenuifilum sp. TaxID=2760880 RepID=UPI003CAEAE7E
IVGKYSHFRNIHLLGAIYDQQVLNSLRYYCKAYIHGHSAGGTNPSLLEAMACGCFIIAHNNPFNRDILGEQGLYFSNETSLGNCVSQFEELNDVEVNKVKKQNIQTIERNFLWPKVALAYIRVIESLKK